MADAKKITIGSDISPAAPVRADPHRLQQVIWNLLNNAIKFTPEGGRVSISVAGDVSNVCVRVVDTGQGIAPEFLPHVFDRFRQAESASTRRHGGLGLGLSIAHQLIELHGGSIAVESLGVGLGAAFTVRLPPKPFVPQSSHTDGAASRSH
jgi:signal transduction histidine kinase